MTGTSPRARFSKRSPAIAVMAAAVLAGIAIATPGFAQDYQTRELIERLNRLERDLGEVQRQFYKGGLPSPDVGLPSTGSSGGVGSTQAADLSVRITQLETELRSVTGAVEKVDFEIGKVRTRLDKLVADVDFRLSAIEKQLATGNLAAQPSGASGQENTAAIAKDDGQPVAATRPQPGTLGTLPVDPSGKAAVAVPSGVLPEGGTAQQHYDFSFNLIRQGDFPEAEQAFREFLAIHGGSDLAGNAQYWLSESFYVREQYQQAARGFLEGYQKYKGHDKAMSSLLKLGMSLVKMDQKKEACASFDQLSAEFPNAADYIKRQVAAERGKVGCK